MQKTVGVPVYAADKKILSQQWISKQFFVVVLENCCGFRASPCISDKQLPVMQNATKEDLPNEKADGTFVVLESSLNVPGRNISLLHYQAKNRTVLFKSTSLTSSSCGFYAGG